LVAGKWSESIPVDGTTAALTGRRWLPG
jgi:hypothetical protein